MRFRTILKTAYSNTPENGRNGKNKSFVIFICFLTAYTAMTILSYTFASMYRVEYYSVRATAKSCNTSCRAMKKETLQVV